MTDNLNFEIKTRSTECKARTATLILKHGDIHTPAFMPVATKATVKTMSSLDMEELGAELLMCNTYHLHLQPGEELIDKAGGLHGFMNWNKPIMTDSAGFQAFSLGYGIEHFAKKIGNYFIGEQKKTDEKTGKKAFVDDEGVTFIQDDRRIHFNPEKSIQIQKKLGADMIIAFDECTSPFADHDYVEKSMKRTHDWAKRSLAEHKRDSRHQALFAVIQGSYFEDLRKESAKHLSALDFDGYCIGGSLGKDKDDMNKIIDWVKAELPEGKPVHLLGIGTVEDLFYGVERGVDLFDCVGPARIARVGFVYISPDAGGNKANKFRIRLNRAAFTEDRNPIDASCSCKVCKNYSRAYIHHLFKANEYLAYYFTTYHNTHFMLRLMEQIRESITEQDFLKLKKRWLDE